MLFRVSLVVLVVALLAGCGGKDDEPPASSTTAATTPAPVLEGASTEATSAPDTTKTTALLTAVRAAAHPGYDRVVFEFSNPTPGYDVRYVDEPLTEDGSGKAVPVAGSAALRVRMVSALDADLTEESAPLTYTGPTRFTPDTAAVAELVRVGGFESVLTWAIGVDGKRPFRVLRLQDPPRIVVDIATG